MTQEQAAIEFCGSTGLNSSHFAPIVKKHKIDARGFLYRLDAETNIDKRLYIAFEFYKLANKAK